MGTRVPPVFINPEKAAEFRRQGRDPDELEANFDRALSDAHYGLPDPPASLDARLFSLLTHDGVDRVSSLPDVLLGNIISRLPIKEAAGTAALSRRWRGVWRSTPLVLVDSHILPAGTTIGRANARRITSVVSSVLAAHPGPLRCVHLTSSYMEESQGLLTCWLQTFAVKGIQELVLFNRPLPLDLVLPATFLGMTTLTRLYLGMWKFPDTAGVPRSTCFPNLRELGFVSVYMESRDLDFILDRSPMLETLCVGGNMFKIPLRLVSQSLRCVQITACSFEEIVVVDAPRLERLIYSGGWSLDGACTKVKIGHAPKLHLLGYLHAGNHVLEVGKTVVKAGTKASPSTLLPSVRILALEVCFGVRNDVKMIPTLLRCFPNVETLHIMVKPLMHLLAFICIIMCYHQHHILNRCCCRMIHQYLLNFMCTGLITFQSRKTDQPSGKVNLKFWNESGTVECIRSRIKLLVFHDFQGDRGERVFLKFLFGSALVLKEVLIVFANASLTSMEDVRSKVAPLVSMKRASVGSSIRVSICSNPEGDNMRSNKRSSDFSIGDPFMN